MKTALALILVITVGDLSRCDDVASQKLSDGANCFTLKMYKELAKVNENLVSSPFSLDVLLSMLYTGAGEQTAQELSNSLGYNGLSVEDVENSFQSKLGKLKSSDGNTLEIANSAWFQKGFEIEQSFKDIVAGKFDSQLSNVDFAGNSHGATQDINNWGNEKTHGLLPELLDKDLDSATIMFLVNAIYFKGQWAKKFEKENTQPGEFKNNDSTDSPSTVPLMNQESKFIYNLDRELQAEILEMDYVGNNFSMVIMLPLLGTNLASLEKSLTCQNFKSSLNSGYSTRVDVTMPKFDISSDFDLKDPIKAVGIKNIFESSANLSGIAQNIVVSQALQKAVIEVNEEGSKAAALTGIGLVPLSASISGPIIVSFRADHPFLYLIKDKRTDLILFIGRVKSLPSSQ